MARVFIVFALLALVFSVAMATDPSPLQDFCVADLNGQVMMNGFTCKDPRLVQADDFFLSGLHTMSNTSNAFKSGLKPVTVLQVPGLNTLGVSLVRIDYAPGGIISLHAHPRASEILTVLEGTLEVGFITSNPDNRHIRKVLYKGDLFVFPVNLIHYQRNIANTNAVSISALSGQNPGVNTVTNVVFGSNPDISTDILAKAFQTTENVISNIQLTF